MKNVIIWSMVLCCALGLVTAGLAVENRGAEEIDIDGGSRGNVPFPHRAHQKRLAECDTCHAVFPRQRGALTALKAEGRLESKFVMNKQCVGCHRSEKRAGNPSGPTTCSGCHQRS